VVYPTSGLPPTKPISKVPEKAREINIQQGKLKAASSYNLMARGGYHYEPAIAMAVPVHT